MSANIYGSPTLPITLLPRELHEAYGSEIASRSAVFRLDDETHISVFLPVFDGWYSPTITRSLESTPKNLIPTWNTHVYRWLFVKGIWQMMPNSKLIEEVPLPNLSN